MKKQYHWGYLVVFLTTVTSLLIWLGSKWYFNDWYDDNWKYLAKIGSMGATTLICWAFILSTRFSIVERLFGGLDKVYKAHRRIAEVAFCLIFLHPIFLAVHRLPEWGHFLSFFWFSGDWVRNTGLIAILMFIVLVALSIGISLKYHVWKQTHHFFGLMLIVVIVHMIIADAEIMRFPLLRAWFFAWLAVAVFCYLYIRLLYRWFGPMYEYQVAKAPEHGDIIEIYLKPRGRHLKHRPGQFIYVSFDTEKLSAEPHPFSISSPPQRPHIRISVKELGNWTGELRKLQGGERAYIWGPYGSFGDKIYKDPKLEPVLIAGGIGLTPFLSMIKDEVFLRVENRKRYLIYSVVKPEEALYHDEIESLHLDHEKFTYISHSSDEEGYLDAETIGEKVNGLDGKVFLICGPGVMMDSIKENLQKHGVGIERIFTEDFSII
ncbi:ferric reductase-like transmembrane domain-containing protein [soil metagenome]